MLPSAGSTPSAVSSGLPPLRPNRRRRSRRRAQCPWRSRSRVLDGSRRPSVQRPAPKRRGHEERPDLQHVGEGVGVFERMRGIGVKEAAAIGAKLLDGFLARHRPNGNDLLGSLDRCRFDRAEQRLRSSERDEDKRDDDRHRQQYVKRRAGQIDPEVADRSRIPRAQSHAPAQRPWRDRSPRRRSCEPSARASARDDSSSSRRCSSASWCW